MPRKSEFSDFKYHNGVYRQKNQATDVKAFQQSNTSLGYCFPPIEVFDHPKKLQTIKGVINNLVLMCVSDC